ncbi:hypothetical protein [Litoribacter populi]|uniref:hypothetical protein n=1 Tax=Litoribacter populi TaxID=2598460 RepID=UPI00117DE8C3|nr:hypothetical protein [Litoribacter populi]
MKLEKILDNLNSFEKNSFLKIIDSILADQPANAKAVDKILSETSKDLKAIDSQNIAKVFGLLESEFKECIKSEFVNTTSQLDILIDIISREGNAIMKQDWFARLYEKELTLMDKRLKKFKHDLENDKSDLDDKRKRDYLIYKKCLHTAYFNDEQNNQEKKITTDEQSILLTLSQQLELSQEEVKLINYLIIPVKKLEIDTVINELKAIGAIFYSRKTSTIYVADEVVGILRKVRGKEVPDKFFRRVLKSLKDPQINLICRKHGIDRKLPIEQKIKDIIHEGISFTGILQEDIYKEGTNLTDRKKFLNDFFDNTLKITPTIKGVLIEEKIDNLISYFEALERDEKIGISVDGYEKMLREMGQVLPKFNNYLREQYEFQEENVLNSHFLLDYNIKPKDVLEILPQEALQEFSKIKEIKTRGDLIQNVLECYKDAENLYLENYENIGFRNMAALKGNSIDIKEADIGIKFEELTKKIFTTLGFQVDEDLRASLNSTKDKADILLNISNNEIIIVECKTVKESGYNKFSSVSRQLKSYANRINGSNYKVVKSILVAPDFSDDFIKECGLEYELNLSLITASTLVQILEGFKTSKLKMFPHNLLMRDVLIQEDRVLKAIAK